MSESEIDRLDRIANGFIEAKILLAAAELRVFDRLGPGGSTAAALAVALGADSRSLEILLDALVAMEILEKRDGVYRTRAEYRHHLDEGSEAHFVAMLRHRNLMFRRWASLEDRILARPGAAPDARPQISDPAANENFIRAMVAASAGGAASVVARIDLAGVRALADFGGGPGRYLQEFARREPGIDLYLVDLPITLDVARRVLAGAPERERIRFVPWDFYGEGEAPAALPPLDLAFLSQVVHSESPERNVELIRRIAALLVPGGRLVVHENAVDEGRTAPRAAALFAVNMLAMSHGGRTYTDAEMSAWGRAAGLERVSGERLGERSYLLVLRRPSRPLS